jgi:hypothetical protein
MNGEFRRGARRVIDLQFRWWFGPLVFVALAGLCQWLAPDLLGWFIVPIIAISMAASLWWGSSRDQHVDR